MPYQGVIADQHRWIVADSTRPITARVENQDNKDRTKSDADARCTVLGTRNSTTRMKTVSGKHNVQAPAPRA